MIHEKRRPVRSGADLLGGGQQSYLTQSQKSNDVPPILRMHFYRPGECDDAVGWSRSLALAAAAWLQRRRAA